MIYRSNIKEVFIIVVGTSIVGPMGWFSTPTPAELWSAIVAAILLGIIFEGVKYLRKHSERFAGFFNNPAVKLGGRVGTLVFVTLVGGAIGFFVAQSFQSRPPPRSILYISPVRSLSDQPFYGEFLDRLIQASAGKNFDVVVQVTDDDWNPSSQQRLLKEVVKRQKEYAAVVFSPFVESKDSKPEGDELFKSFSGTKDFNTIIFDTELSESLRGRLIADRLAIPPCVQGQEWEAGKLAALALVQYLYENQIWRPNIAVFDKLVPMQRSMAFRRFFELGAEEKHIRPNPLIPWYWSAKRGINARDIAREVASTNLNSTIDGVFAGNDVTALGVRDVILDLQGKGTLPLKKKIAVVGYDGVAEVRELLKARNESIIINSVDVNLVEQANSIVSFVSRLNSSDREQALRHKLDDKCEAKTPHLIKSVPGE